MNFTSKYQDQQINSDNFSYLKENVLFFLRRLHWFIICVSIAIFIANIKLKYASPYYQATAKVLFKSDENGGLFNEGSAFQDLGYGYNYSPIENEIETLKSRSLMKKVVKDLKLNVVWYNNDGLIPVEEYENQTLNVTFLNGDSSIYKTQAFFDITIISENSFLIENESSKYKLEGSFGKPFKSKVGELILTPANKNSKLKNGQKLSLCIYEIETAVNMYVGSLLVDRPNDMSNILEISIVDNSTEKAKDIVNNIIKQHQNETILDKNQVSRNSAAFINDRINIISKELSSVEGNVLDFKTNRNIVDVATEATLFMENQQEIEKNIVDNEIQLKLAEYVNEYIKENKNATELIPTNLGLSDLSIENNITTYNNLVLERNRILKNSNEKNPIALNLESKILNLQDNLRESLKKLELNLKLRGKQLSLRNKKLGNQIASVPRQEKELREIQRQQQIKEQLYLYLLQKREETAITLSLTVANSRVIDEAYSNGNIVSPNRKNAFLVALIIGLIIPFIVLLFIKTTKSKVSTKEDIERLGLKVIAEIPVIKNTKQHSIFTNNEKSSFAESFRLLRTNLDFLLGSIKSTNNVIVITSTIPNEGKSFVSLNLAKSLSLVNKKVIVVGMDLRSPSLHSYLDIKATKGVSNFIIDSDLTLDNLIVKHVGGYQFDLLNAGDVPPNPSELLQHNRVTELFKELEKLYDYIIVDTAPIGIVSDTLLLNKFSDLFLFIVRNDHLEKKALKFIKDLKNENKIRNIQIIYNCSKGIEKYGDKYGYYYGHDKKNKFQQFISIFRS
jgi:tyrosine-protein kinase Etk/Wzc